MYYYQQKFSTGAIFCSASQNKEKNANNEKGFAILF